ncbi:MAG: 6-bladed beta-propeller [Gemmatimonadales bacterium]|jgi:hypothetical protein
MRAALTFTLPAVLLGACADRSWDSGPITFTDSAGVAIVTNEGTSQDVAEWRTEPLLTIGQLEGGEEYAFGEIADVALDRRGRVVVLDRLAQQAMAYDTDGSFLFRVGGAGEGPGELSPEVMSIGVGPGDSIAILDYWQMRLNVYTPDGAPARTVSMRSFGRQGPYEFHLLGDGRLLVRWYTYEVDREGRFLPWDALLLSDEVQEPFDTLMALDYRPPPLGDVRELLRPLFLNVAFYDVLADGRIVWSALEEEQITIHARDGALERIVRNREWRRRAATAADREVLESVYRAGGDGRSWPSPEQVVLPDSIPTITAVRASPDGGFWVQRMGRLSGIDPGALFLPAYLGWLGGTTWEVYDRDGRRHATVRLPARFRLTGVGDSTVVGIHRDDMDVERVMVLRVVR